MLYSVLVEDRMYLIHYVWPGILNISTQVSTSITLFTLQ